MWDACFNFYGRTQCNGFENLLAKAKIIPVTIALYLLSAAFSALCLTRFDFESEELPKHFYHAISPISMSMFLWIQVYQNSVDFRLFNVARALANFCCFFKTVLYVGSVFASQPHGTNDVGKYINCCILAFIIHYNNLYCYVKDDFQYLERIGELKKPKQAPLTATQKKIVAFYTFILLSGVYWMFFADGLMFWYYIEGSTYAEKFQNIMAHPDGSFRQEGILAFIAFAWKYKLFRITIQCLFQVLF
uniref:Cas1_AcylT domain-containing protein n=1 Tax=Panagrellus redivivus TaxID=6233 RepID=A0A7E4W0E7_PANRE